MTNMTARSGGKRNTIQRAMIFEAVQSLHTHPTGEEVYALVRSKYPSISLATVYRNLNTLAEEGQIKRICVPGAAERFDFNTKPHYHIRCEKCGQFADVPLEYDDKMVELIARATGYTLHQQEMVFTGLCPDCAKEALS